MSSTNFRAIEQNTADWPAGYVSVLTVREGGLDSESLADIVRRLRRSRGYSQAQLANKYGFTRPWITQVETGRIERPDIDLLTRLANALRVPPATLLTPAGYKVDPEPIRDPTTAELARELLARIEGEVRPLMLPVEDHYISASPATGHVAGEAHAYYPESGERGHDFRVFKVAGDCMAPEINRGEKIVVDTTREAHEGDTVAVTHDGDVCVKRLERQYDGWHLTAMDGTDIKANGETRIIGVVVEVARRLV